jgi:5-dehydro-2-deoxygluconokinase
LCILPFDHRGSFQKKMFGWDGALSPEQTAKIADAKRVIYDGFVAAVQAGVDRQKPVLVGEQFGAAIARRLRRSGRVTRPCSPEVTHPVVS